MDPSMPAGKPPPGVIPNLIDPPNLEAVTIAIGVLMIVMTALVVSTRLYTNVFVIRSMGLEDYSCICAVISLYTYIGLVFYLNKFARHIWDTPAIWLDAAFFKQRFARDMFISPALFFAKATILLLYLRLFKPTRWLRYTIYAMLVFMAMVYGCYIIVNAALCAPAPGQSWLYPGVLAKCQKQETYSVIQGACNVVVDIAILVLPIPIVWAMKMQRSKKFGILAIFSTGAIALICSILSLVYRVKLDGAPDWSYIGAESYIAIIVEVGITIICSCAPALFSLGKHLFQDTPLFASIRSRIGATSNHKQYPSGKPLHHRHSAKQGSRHSSSAPIAKSADPLSTRRSDNGYLELGEVSDSERKVEGGAYGSDVEGRKPSAGRKDLGITRTTDVEVVFGGRERDGY